MALAILMTGCGDADPEASPPPIPSGASLDPAVPDSNESELLRPPDSEGSPETETRIDEEVIRVIFLGTSLTEGRGLDRPSTEAWPRHVASLADSAGIVLRVMNAGVSGETSAGALRRLEWVMRQFPDVLVVETGANDALRGCRWNSWRPTSTRLFAE